jgi:hypothetical protein
LLNFVTPAKSFAGNLSFASFANLARALVLSFVALAKSFVNFVKDPAKTPIPVDPLVSFVDLLEN